MKTLIEDKIEVKAYISKSLNERFRKLINQKHGGFMRGLLSYEIEQALAQYVASYNRAGTHTQETQIEKANPSPKIYQLKEDIIQYLASSSYYAGKVPQFFPENFLIEAIHSLKGYDKRTYNHWYDLLIRYGCIKKSGGNQYEFV